MNIKQLLEEAWRDLPCQYPGHKCRWHYYGYNTIFALKGSFIRRKGKPRLYWWQKVRHLGFWR